MSQTGDCAILRHLIALSATWEWDFECKGDFATVAHYQTALIAIIAPSPAQAIGGVGTCTPQDPQPCRLLQCNGDVSLFHHLRRLPNRVAARIASGWPTRTKPLARRTLPRG